MAAVHEVLHDAIARAYPEFATHLLSDRSIVLEGEPENLALAAPLPRPSRPASWPGNILRGAGRPGRSALFMAWHLDLPAADGSATLPDHRVELVDRVRRVTFGYFGHPAPGQQSAWSDRWTGSNHLPEMVRFHIEFDDPARSAWSDPLPSQELR